MFAPCVWVRHKRRVKFIGPQVELISDNHALDFASRQNADFHQTVLDRHIGRQDQRATVRGPFGKSKRSRRNIHLAITDKKITVTAEAPETLVLMDVSVVGVQKAAMTYHQIKDRIAVAVRVVRVASEDIEDLPSIVFAPGKLAVAMQS